MLLLTYFNRVLGPKVLLTYPKNLLDNLNQEYIKQVKSLLDSSDTGFFTHFFSPELKTANWIFEIRSEWARGRSELVMISVIVSEAEPDFSIYEKFLSRSVEKIKQLPNIYKAFYVETDKSEVDQQIQEKYDLLKKELNNLYKILAVKRIETEGKLLTFTQFESQQSIPVSKHMISKLESLTDGGENCFIVFRSRDNALKIDVIPVDSMKVVKFAIFFGEQMTIPVMQEITKIFSKHEDILSLVYTSGICQEVDKCIYEVYIKADVNDLNVVIEDIYKIEGVLEIDVTLIKLNTTSS